MQGVHMGRRVHLVAEGHHRTACNRLVNKIIEGGVWVERPRVDAALVDCSVCQRVARKEHERELDRKYGKVPTMQNGLKWGGS